MQWGIALLLCLGLVQTGQAVAGTYTFTDNIYEFAWNPNETGKSGIESNGSNPQINTITVDWDSQGYLQTVTVTTGNSFYYTNNLYINTDYVGDLNVNNNTYFTALQDWDWYVTTTSATSSTLYEVTSGLAGNSYTDYYTFATSGRSGHINGIDSDYLNAVYSPSSWATTSNPLTFVYDFSSFNINLGSQFVIAYTETCANDVFVGAYATGVTPAVPEPATLSLLGLGMVGLAVWQFRRASNKK